MGLVDALTTPGGIVETAAKAALAMADGNLKRPRRKKNMVDRLSSFPPVRAKILREAGKQVARRTRGLYPAPPAILDCVETGLKRGPARVSTESRIYFGKLATGMESRNLVRLFHAMNRAKKPGDGPESRKIDRLAVLGAGFMGAGVASVSLGTLSGGAQGHLGRGPRRRDPHRREWTRQPGAIGRHHPARGRPAGDPRCLATTDARRSRRGRPGHRGGLRGSRSQTAGGRRDRGADRTGRGPGLQHLGAAHRAESPRAPGTPSGSSGCTTSRRCPRCRCSRSSSPRIRRTGRRRRPRRSVRLRARPASSSRTDPVSTQLGSSRPISTRRWCSSRRGRRSRISIAS